MAIKEIFESVTDKIDLATELLSELSDREGKYVWAKCEPGTTITVTQITESKNPTIMQLASDDVDLSTYTAADLVGLGSTWYNSTTNSTYYFTETTFQMGSSAFTYTYDPTTAQVALAVGMGGGRTFNPITIPPTVIEFVVSDDITAYPDKGKLDGYWYELVEFSTDGSSLSIDYGTVTVSASGQSSITINHKLGITPSKVYLVPSTFTTDKTGTKLITNNVAAQFTSATSYSIRTQNQTKSATSVTFTNSASFAQMAYMWFVIA